jgi:hypothetical protein
MCFLCLQDQFIMNLNNQLTLSILSGEALTLHFGDVLQPVKEHLLQPALVPVNQWDDDEEELADDDDLDLDVEEDEDWEDEEFDIDEEDFDLDEEEDDADFDSIGDDDEEGFYDDEPEDLLGHQVEDRNPSPCNPAYAVEARMELL